MVCAPGRVASASGEGRAWLERVDVPGVAREQIEVAIAMSEALDSQIAPLDRQLRTYARRQAGCRALMGHYGSGELTSVAILAELGDCRRFCSHVRRCATPGWTSRSMSPTRSAVLVISRARARPFCVGRSMKPRKPPDVLAAPTAATTTKPPNDSDPTARDAIARKLLARSYHTLRELGEEALQPA